MNELCNLTLVSHGRIDRVELSNKLHKTRHTLISTLTVYIYIGIKLFHKVFHRLRAVLNEKLGKSSPKLVGGSVVVVNNMANEGIPLARILLPRAHRCIAIA